jgi:hypothetical protein
MGFDGTQRELMALFLVVVGLLVGLVVVLRMFPGAGLTGLLECGLSTFGGAVVISVRATAAHHTWVWRIASYPGWCLIALGAGLAGEWVLARVYSPTADPFILFTLGCLLVSQAAVWWVRRQPGYGQ